MSHPRINIRELDTAGATSGGASGAFGVPLEDQFPVPVSARSPANRSDSRDATPTHSWWARGARLVRNAAIAVAFMALVPIGLVAYRGDRLARIMFQTNTDLRSRAAATDALRPFRVPSDPSITPMQAGLALNALQQNRKTAPGFEPIEPATRPAFIWRTAAISAEMFPTARPDFYTGPSSQTILEAGVKGFSPREREYLRALATAPLWREFDLVARAPAVDVVGGRFRLPFGENAIAEHRPLAQFDESKEMAYAAVSRATYHMAEGQRDSAEIVLRSIVSFGLAFVDNGTSGKETMIGNVIVGIGRDALQRFYLIGNDPRATLPALALWEGNASTRSRRQTLISPDDARRDLLARVQNAGLPRGDSFQSLRSLSMTSCTSVRELMFGSGTDVRDAIEGARKVARYPSDAAVVDLNTREPSSIGSDLSLNPTRTLAVSSATVAGTVLRNPRLAACTRIMTGW